MDEKIICMLIALGLGSSVVVLWLGTAAAIATVFLGLFFWGVVTEPRRTR